MKLTIVHNIQPTYTLGQLEVSELSLEPERTKYYIDDILVPPTLARIIELGLALQTQSYLKSIEEEMELMKNLKEGL